MTQNIYDKHFLLFKNTRSNETKRLVLQVTDRFPLFPLFRDRPHIDRFDAFSLLAAAQCIFHRSLAIAGRFIKNWLVFPRFPPTCKEIRQVLAGTQLAGTQKEGTQLAGDFSVDCIEEAFQEITCLTELAMEILRTVEKGKSLDRRNRS